jgi:hypothetical protein
MKARWVTIAVVSSLFLSIAAFAQQSGLDPDSFRKDSPRKATLSRLVANPEAFVGEILDKWSPTARSRGYDVAAWREEMGQILLAQSADRQLGAFEAPTYDRLVSLLSGVKGKPAASSDDTLGLRPMIVGSNTSDLVYIPIVPCRLFNTLVAGGALAPNVVRTFGVADNSNFAAQGGDGPCGIPSDPAAVAINFTAVIPSGPGDVRAFPYGSPVPNASIVNYTNVPNLNLANSTILTVCFGCGAGLDIQVRADVNGTHLIGDAQGYFAAPTPCVAGQANLLGLCVEVGLRAGTTVFSASDDCEGLGGRVADPLELRSLRGVLALDATGEWTDAIQSPDGSSFFSMIIADGGGFTRVSTVSSHPYRCVYRQFAH